MDKKYNVSNIDWEKIKSIVNLVAVVDPQKRKCYLCQKIKNNNEFYGTYHECIDCTKGKVAKWIHKNRSKVNTYHREQKIKGRARAMINYYVKKGKISVGECVLKNNNCSNKIQAHHYLGYEKEHYLDVKWVCSRHHHILDGRSWGKDVFKKRQSVVK